MYTYLLNVYIMDIKMARKTKEDAEQTRLAILDSALQTFYEKGFSRTTFDEIAKRINLTKGAVYWYFRNKTDLISALIMQKILEHRKNYHYEVSDSLSSLRCGIINRAQAIEKDADFRRFLFFVIYRMEWSPAVFDKVWSEIGELCELPDKELYDLLLRIQKKNEIRADVNIKELMQIMICLWKGIVDKYILGVNLNMDLTTAMTKGFDMIISGIKVEK